MSQTISIDTIYQVSWKSDIDKKLKNRGCGWGANFIYFPGTVANLNVYWTFLITWQIHWYVFHFSTTNSLGGVPGQRKSVTHLHTEIRIDIFSQVAYIYIRKSFIFSVIKKLQKQKITT